MPKHGCQSPNHRLFRGNSWNRLFDLDTLLLDPHSSIKSSDDGSLAFLFKDYIDDGIREPIIDFGEAIGNEQW